MSGSSAAGSLPWYRTVGRAQWKALIASNLGWTFDGFEVFALILTMGAALHQLLDPSAIQTHSGVCGRGYCDNRVRVGRRRPPWRHPRRLYRPQAIDDAHDLRLFAADGFECAILELVVLCALSLSRRTRDRLRMGDRSFDHRRALAGQRAGQRRRLAASRISNREHHCLRPLGRDRHVKPECVALHVPGRRIAGAGRILDPAQHSGIEALGAIERAAAKRS